MSHQRSVGKSDNRFTPRWLWEALGPFETDAATADVRPWSIGAARNVTPADDTLAVDWRSFGRTWLNPPFNRYSVGAFVQKMLTHAHGTMLLHVRTSAAWFRPIWGVATAALFLGQRVVFCNADGTPCRIESPEAKHFGKVANSGADVVLFAFGMADADLLDASRLEGDFLPINLPRRIIALFFDTKMRADRPWRELVADYLQSTEGPISVAELYRAFALHPKAQANPNYKAKLRQTLQRGAGKSLGRDQWVAA